MRDCSLQRPPSYTSVLKIQKNITTMCHRFAREQDKKSIYTDSNDGNGITYCAANHCHLGSGSGEIISNYRKHFSICAISARCKLPLIQTVVGLNSLLTLLKILKYAAEQYQILCKTIQEKFCTWDHTIVSLFVKWQCGKQEQYVATTQLYCISIRTISNLAEKIPCLLLKELVTIHQPVTQLMDCHLCMDFLYTRWSIKRYVSMGLPWYRKTITYG